MHNHRLILDNHKITELITYVLAQNETHLEDLKSLASNFQGEHAAIFAQALEFYASGNEALAKARCIVEKIKDS